MLTIKISIILGAIILGIASLIQFNDLHPILQILLFLVLAFIGALTGFLIGYLITFLVCVMQL
jgi:hypothetical protein